MIIPEKHRKRLITQGYYANVRFFEEFGEIVQEVLIGTLNDNNKGVQL